MTDSICGIDCGQCPWNGQCSGCTGTDGRPFGGTCVLALRYREGEAALREFKKKLIAAFRALPMEELAGLSDLNALRGSFINLEFTLPGGQKVKFWDDDRIYLGNQICRNEGGRCYGLAADEHYLMVCEYGDCGIDPELIVFKRWN